MRSRHPCRVCVYPVVWMYLVPLLLLKTFKADLRPHGISPPNTRRGSPSYMFTRRCGWVSQTRRGSPAQDLSTHCSFPFCDNKKKQHLELGLTGSPGVLCPHWAGRCLADREDGHSRSGSGSRTWAVVCALDVTIGMLSLIIIILSSHLINKNSLMSSEVRPHSDFPGFSQTTTFYDGFDENGTHTKFTLCIWLPCLLNH